MNKNSILSNNIAKGGILTALGILSLYLSILIPINTLFFLMVASFMIPLTLLTTNLKTTVSVYCATALLSFILIPSKNIALSYTILFGLYGIIKYFAEGIKNMFLEILVKLLFLNFSTFIIYYFYKTLLLNNINLKLPTILILILLQVGFIVYDYALTVFINYSKDNIIKKLK